MTESLSSGECLRSDIEAILEESGMELDPREARFLDEAVLTANLLDALQEVIDRDGPTVADPRTGAISIHPAVVELRLSRQTLQRLLGGVEIPGAKANVLASQHGKRAAARRWETHPARTPSAR